MSKIHPDISKKVREFLVARALFNRKNHKSKNLEYLTANEWKIVNDPHRGPSHTWFLRNLSSGLNQLCRRPLSSPRSHVLVESPDGAPSHRLRSP